MTTRVYKCAVCGGEFMSDRPDEEALAEAKDLWGTDTLTELAVICDDCFNGRTPGTLSYQNVLSMPDVVADVQRRKGE